MQDKELCEKVLGLKAPWFVSDVDLQMEKSKVMVRLAHAPLVRFRCPECELERPTHDHRHRHWRHLDTCGFVTMIEADVPRVNCPAHGVRQIKVPWAEPGSGFTALFEALAISWLKVAPVNAVSERMQISWDEAWGIKERAVRRGLERRESAAIEELAVDETSFQKRHEYVTVLVDRKTGIVIDILDDRKKVTLNKWLQANKDQLREVRSVSMDMWEPFITAVQETIEGSDGKICFDRFHVAGHFGKALDKVRATEHRELGGAGDSPLTKTKHDWLEDQGKQRLQGQTGIPETDEAEPQDGSGMEDQGNGQRHVVVLLSRSRRTQLEGTPGVDIALPTRSGDQGRKDGPPLPLGHPECHQAQSNQSDRRIHERDHPEDQGEGMRIQKQGSV